MVAAPTVFDHCSSLEKEDNREKDESEKISKRAREDRRATKEGDRKTGNKGVREVGGKEKERLAGRLESAAAERLLLATTKYIAIFF